MSENKWNKDQRFEEIMGPVSALSQKEVSQMETYVVNGDIQGLVKKLLPIVRGMYLYDDYSSGIEYLKGEDKIVFPVDEVNIIVSYERFIKNGLKSDQIEESGWGNEDVAKYILLLLLGDLVKYRMVVPSIEYGVYKCSVYLEGA